MLAEEDLPYPKHDSPHSEHHGPKTPRPEHKRHDRPRYEQDGGCQAKHSRTRWVSPSHQSLIIMPPTRARCELRRITLPRTPLNKASSLLWDTWSFFWVAYCWGERRSVEMSEQPSKKKMSEMPGKSSSEQQRKIKS